MHAGSECLGCRGACCRVRRYKACRQIRGRESDYPYGPQWCMRSRMVHDARCLVYACLHVVRLHASGISCRMGALCSYRVSDTVCNYVACMLHVACCMLLAPCCIPHFGCCMCGADIARRTRYATMRTSLSMRRDVDGTRASSLRAQRCVGASCSVSACIMQQSAGSERLPCRAGLYSISSWAIISASAEPRPPVVAADLHRAGAAVVLL